MKQLDTTKDEIKTTKSEVKVIQLEPKKEEPTLTADNEEILPYITLKINPVAKPRMTQSDKWKKRPAVVKYWKYKDNLKLLCFLCRWKPSEELDITFVIPMPISWSKKKRVKYNDQPHKSRPDLDNLVKAFKDALLEEDSMVHTYENIKKVWGREGQIIVKR